MGKHNVSVIQVNRDVPTEYNGLQKQSKCDPGSTTDVDNQCLTTSLFSTRPLRRHVADISKHKTLTKTDILCFAVSWFCANDDTKDIPEDLKTFTIYFNWRVEKFETLNFLYKQR